MDLSEARTVILERMDIVIGLVGCLADLPPHDIGGEPRTFAEALRVLLEEPTPQERAIGEEKPTSEERANAKEKPSPEERAMLREKPTS